MPRIKDYEAYYEEREKMGNRTEETSVFFTNPESFRGKDYRKKRVRKRETKRKLNRKRVKENKFR